MCGSNKVVILVLSGVGLLHMVVVAVHWVVVLEQQYSTTIVLALMNEIALTIKSNSSHRWAIAVVVEVVKVVFCGHGSYRNNYQEKVVSLEQESFLNISCGSIVMVQIVNTVHGIFTVSRFCHDLMFMVLQHQAECFCWSNTGYGQVLVHELALFSIFT